MSGHASTHRSVWDLLGPTVRALPWGQLLGAGLVVGLFGVLAAADDHMPVALAVDRVRLLLPLLAVTVAAVLDDATRPELDSAPVRLVVRQGLRLALALPVIGGCWLLLLVVAGSRVTGSPHDAGLPVGALTVVLWAMVALTLATAGVVTRRRGGHGGLPAAGVALVLPSALFAFDPLRQRWFPPHPSSLFGPSSDEIWRAAHQRWATVAVVATGVLLWSLRDPARRALSPWPTRPVQRGVPRRRPSDTMLSEGTTR